MTRLSSTPRHIIPYLFSAFWYGLVVVSYGCGKVPAISREVIPEPARKTVPLGPRQVEGLATSPDSKWLAVLCDQDLLLLDAGGDIVVQTPVMPGSNSLTWMNSRIYVAEPNGKLAVYDWTEDALDLIGSLDVETGLHRMPPGTCELATYRTTVFALLPARRQLVGIGPQGEERGRVTLKKPPASLQPAPNGELVVDGILRFEVLDRPPFLEALPSRPLPLPESPKLRQRLGPWTATVADHAIVWTRD